MQGCQQSALPPPPSPPPGPRAAGRGRRAARPAEAAGTACPARSSRSTSPPPPRRCSPRRCLFPRPSGPTRLPDPQARARVWGRAEAAAADRPRGGPRSAGRRGSRAPSLGPRARGCRRRHFLRARVTAAPPRCGSGAATVLWRCASTSALSVLRSVFENSSVDNGLLSVRMDADRVIKINFKSAQLPLAHVPQIPPDVRIRGCFSPHHDQIL